jgi:glycosyltransferase involved in cell wall biosynthesis
VTLQITSPEPPTEANPLHAAAATRPWRSITAAPRVGFVSGVLEGTGGLELFELTAAQGLARRGWDVVCVYEQPGDLLGAWTATADVHARGDGALRDVDVLYVHDVQRLPAAIDIRRRHGVPIVCHLHLPPFHLRSGLAGRLTGRHRYAVDEDVIGRRTPVDRFIAVSHRLRRLWVEAGLPADRVEVVHNGVDVDRFRPAAPGERERVRAALGLAEDAFVVAYVGRLERMKGVGELFRAFRAVDAATSRPMRLLVVGGPSRPIGAPIDAEKDAFVVHLHRSAPRGTSWLGRRQDVPELMRALDLLVVPSQWDEPFGLVAAEAMASGIPVVGTRKGGLTEVLTGPLAADAVGTSWRAIARAIRRHVEDPARGARLGVEGRRLATTRFDIERTVQEIERVLRGVS